MVAVALPLISDALWVSVGSIFPVLIMLYAIPLRSHIMPKYFFHEHHLQVLDHSEELLLETPLASKPPAEPDDDLTPYMARGAPEGLARVLTAQELELIASELPSEQGQVEAEQQQTGEINDMPQLR